MRNAEQLVKNIRKQTDSDSREWILWRQDDNGNRFAVRAFQNRDDAMHEKRVMESKGHKQTYWVAELEKDNK